MKDPMLYQAVRLDGLESVRPWPPASLSQAIADRRSLKRRGFTAWIEDTAGNFIPVEGAKTRRLQEVAARANERAAANRAR